mgnify:CR=1 FL=1
MQAIVAQLQAKRLFPERARALELFGMYGFWATMDYLPRVESVDFFEIDEARLHLSRRNLRSRAARSRNPNRASRAAPARPSCSCSTPMC